jgi:subtilisin family serine protease
VVAAGNEYSVSKLSFPACVSTAIAVGATTKSNAVAVYTNSSPALDMWAPGSSIASSVPTDMSVSGYGSASGTSMAAPHVAGAFAVIDELMPTASLATKEYRIVKTGPSIKDPGNGITRRRLKLSSDLTPPSTKMTARPPSTTTLAKVTFKFSSESGAKFECRLNAGSWAACSSPKAVTVAKGNQTFGVRARDAAGNADATPSQVTWRRK